MKQSGSLVAPDHLRFDFTHFAAVDSSELAEIEQQVNEEILKNPAIQTDIKNIDDALASGALAFFGDKHPEANVRVVTIPDAAAPRGFYSRGAVRGHPCGPDWRDRHAGRFSPNSPPPPGFVASKPSPETGLLSEYQRTLSQLRVMAGLLNVSDENVVVALERQMEAVKTLEKQIEALKRKAAGSQVQGLLEQVREVKGVRVLAAQVGGSDRETLRQLVDALRQKLGSGVVVLATADEGKVALITAVTKDLIPRLHAGKIVQELARLVGGSGGGRPDLAEAGGKDTSAIENALGQVYPTLDRLFLVPTAP